MNALFGGPQGAKEGNHRIGGPLGSRYSVNSMAVTLSSFYRV